MNKLFLAVLLFVAANVVAQEQHRPRFHFSPKEKWINDPNGMFYYKGIYHLFYQYYPDDTKWGPMHWGHTISKDMIHWQEQPVALYPDSLGYIFSGSAVVDVNNTSGFGKDDKTPIVAIFTHHDPNGEKEKRNDFQVQSIAYSLDEGKTFKKYSGNPVVPNPGITDFRDPKVMWYEPQKKWIMTLATKDRITFYSSPDLQQWNRESEFGADKGAHGGVWECPDLFPLQLEGKEYWVLLVSINPGGPNGGSVTQYFIGDFDGKNFTPMDDEQRWMDYGPDNYAGVTFSNLGDRKVLMGWMSNWQYAQVVPTEKWRGAFTLPRELSLKKAGGKIYLASSPAKEFDKILGKKAPLEKNPGLFQLEFSASAAKDFSVSLSNAKNEELIIGYDKAANKYYIDRTKSGKVDFEPGFAKRVEAARISDDKNIKLRLVADVASVELFADDGLTVMTAIFFPSSLLNNVNVKGVDENNVKLTAIKP